MSRLYPLPNPARAYPVAPSGRAYPVPATESFFLFPGTSQRVELNQTVYPFAGLTIASGFTLTLVEYHDGVGWNTVTAGSHASALDALRATVYTPTVWAQPETWQVRLTESGGLVRTQSVDLTTEVLIREKYVRGKVDTRFKPFASASFAATATGLSTVKYSVSGAATVSKTDIPRVTVVTGTHTGANNVAILTDSAGDFINNGVQVGDTVSNDTDASEGAITARTATTITATLSGGTDDDWDTSDAYTVYAADDLRLRALNFEYRPAATGTHLLTLFVHDGTSELSDEMELIVAA